MKIIPNCLKYSELGIVLMFVFEVFSQFIINDLAQFPFIIS